MKDAMAKHTVGLQHLPDDAIANIANQLSITALFQFALTCKSIFRVATSEQQFRKRLLTAYALGLKVPVSLRPALLISSGKTILSSALLGSFLSFFVMQWMPDGTSFRDIYRQMYQQKFSGFVRFQGIGTDGGVDSSGSRQMLYWVRLTIVIVMPACQGLSSCNGLTRSACRLITCL